ncbi:hypothetical protein DFP74_6405 [Nocardiopsis sp. Huas11]|uniref:antibiotic resistance protein VanZ n=1 Tax=Nocardiopsis sp. Huas11 TaxID=2183912 RepID=UPI000EB0EDA5|nr:antibiotic resistance protein VanZ [Nocardiopsis sp. Huas11]RKS10630.1 hypothetical protein DFP74_6405 [Nocardiopsis sp. Huas11]
MGQPFGGGQAAIEVAVAAVPLLVVIGAALYLRGQHRRYGRRHGWPGRLTTAALVTGVGVVLYAVWPLPANADGLCALDPSVAGARPGPALPWAAPADTVRAMALAFALFLPVGFLARWRFRRGWALTLVVGTALAAAAALLRATGVLGLYPCAYADTSPPLVALGAAGTLTGWLIARWVLPLWPTGPARGWPAALPDRLVPDLGRRMTGALLDLGLWWYGTAALVAVLHAYDVVRPTTVDEVRAAALVASAAVFALVLPHLRRDRATLGAAAVHLALTAPTAPRPADRWRVLVRTLLLQAPVVLLLALGPAWGALAVIALHGSTAVVRPDRAGLADLVCGVRVRTRSLVDGGLPDRLVRYTAPVEPVGAGLSSTPGSPAADR